MSDQPPANPDDLRSAARNFASGAGEVRDRFHYLVNNVSELLSGADAWAGSGSQQFQAVWNRASRDASQAADALDHTAQVLTQFADAIEQIQTSRDWQIAIGVAMGVVTVFLTVVDIMQAGLDPVTDAATVATAAEAEAAVTAVGEGFAAAEEAAVTGLETASEMTPEIEGIAGDTGEMAGEGGGVVDLPPEEPLPTAPGEGPPPEEPPGELPPEETPPGTPGEGPPPEGPPPELPNPPKVPSDPTQPPGEGFEWRGRGDPSSGKGSWYNPETGESMHPDLNHPEPIGPHWDYTAPDGSQWRIDLDGNITPK